MEKQTAGRDAPIVAENKRYHARYTGANKNQNIFWPDTKERPVLYQNRYCQFLSGSRSQSTRFFTCIPL